MSLVQYPILQLHLSIEKGKSLTKNFGSNLAQQFMTSTSEKKIYVPLIQQISLLEFHVENISKPKKEIHVKVLMNTLADHTQTVSLALNA